jgi:hypothetical protein
MARVRNLEREVGTLCRKVAKQVAEGKTTPIHITADDVPEHLGRPRFFEEVAEQIDRPGIATGLTWTPVGGEIIFIETAAMPSKESQLILTGQLGDVMKESAMAVLSYVRSHPATSDARPLACSPVACSGDDQHRVTAPAGMDGDGQHRRVRFPARWRGPGGNGRRRPASPLQATGTVARSRVLVEPTSIDRSSCIFSPIEYTDSNSISIDFW